MESEKKDLELKLDQSSPTLPHIHPNLAVIYKQKVEKLYEALSDPEVKTEAAEILNSLIERINIITDKSGCYVELVGDIVKLITLPEGSDVPASFESSVKVVAGARNRFGRLGSVEGLLHQIQPVCFDAGRRSVPLHMPRI